MSQKKLKILFVLQNPWGSGLGMAKVHFDLKRAMEEKGHQVDYLDHKMLYPTKEGFVTHLLGKNTQERILDYLKKHAYRYDIIDANQRCIPYPKKEYGFKGVVVYRSHGFQPLYRIAEQSPLYKKMTISESTATKLSLKNHLGNLKRYFLQGAGEWAMWDSIKYADIVHCLNYAEYNYLKAYGIQEQKLVVVANGIDNDLLNKGRDYKNNISNRSEISFLGSWTIRKGITHLPYIADKLKEKYTHFNLLGTLGNNSEISNTFSKESRPKIKVTSEFDSKDLHTLLAKTKVGVFPSYVEGFGLSVIEFLAVGIPVVAFATPGPSDILSPIDDTLLVPLGDQEQLATKIKEIIEMPANEYQQLCTACYQRALNFDYNKIADEFINIYTTQLEKLGE